MISCPACERSLPRSSFGVDTSRKSGLQRLCRECRRAANKKDYKRNKKRQKKFNKEIAFTMERVSHMIVARGLRNFEIEPHPCEVCDSMENVVAHHDDYSKPLVVRWLCRTHHKEWHDKNGPGAHKDDDGEALAEEYGRPRRTRTDVW